MIHLRNNGILLVRIDVWFRLTCDSADVFFTVYNAFIGTGFDLSALSSDNSADIISAVRITDTSRIITLKNNSCGITCNTARIDTVFNDLDIIMDDLINQIGTEFIVSGDPFIAVIDLSGISAGNDLAVVFTGNSARIIISDDFRFVFTVLNQSDGCIDSAQTSGGSFTVHFTGCMTVLDGTSVNTAQKTRNLLFAG